jgi:hypothetical protein
MYHTEYQVILIFTSLSCIRLLVVTTDYTLVLYLCRGEGSTYGNGCHESDIPLSLLPTLTWLTTFTDTEYKNPLVIEIPLLF